MPLSKSYNYIITIEGDAYNPDGYNWERRLINPEKLHKSTNIQKISNIT